MDEDSPLDLRLSTESYLQYLKFPPGNQLPPANFRDLFKVESAKSLQFWSDPDTALENAIQGHFAKSSSFDTQNFFYAGPKNSGLEKRLQQKFPALKISRLGSDPEEMLELKTPLRSFYLLYSPNPKDSSFWSHELLLRVAHRLLENAESYLMLDESLASLFWEPGTDVGTLRHQAHSRMGVLLSLGPWSGHESKLTMTYHSPADDVEALDPSSPEMIEWSNLQQIWIRDFHSGVQHLRLRTALSRNTRTLLEELRDLIQAKTVECLHWPKAGSSILLRLKNLTEIEAHKKIRDQKLLVQLETSDSSQAVEIQIVVPLNGPRTHEIARRIKLLVSQG